MTGLKTTRGVSFSSVPDESRQGLAGTYTLRGKHYAGSDSAVQDSVQLQLPYSSCEDLRGV